MPYEKIKALLESSCAVLGEEEFELMGAATEDEIAAAEAALGITFPPDYRRYLADYGAVVVEGLGIHGVFPGGDEEFPGVVEATCGFRTRGGPHHLLPIVTFEDCDFVLDLTPGRAVDNEPPALVWVAGVPAAEQFSEPWAWNFARLVERLFEELDLLPEGDDPG